MAGGILHCQLGNCAEAEEYSKSLLQVVPGAPEGCWWLGETYRRWGKWGDAALVYERAVALAPGEAQYHYDMARAYRELGRLEDALRSYEKALSLGPDNEDIAQELAQLRDK